MLLLNVLAKPSQRLLATHYTGVVGRNVIQWWRQRRCSRLHEGGGQRRKSRAMNGTARVCIYVQMVDTRYIYLPRKMCNFEHYVHHDGYHSIAW